MDKENIITAILTPSQYRALEERVVNAQCCVSSETTPLQAGYSLGVQAVLKLLRDGFVSGHQ